MHGMTPAKVAQLIEVMRRMNAMIRIAIDELTRAGCRSPWDVWYVLEHEIFLGNIALTYSFVLTAGGSKLREFEHFVDRHPAIRFRRGYHDGRQRVAQMLIRVSPPQRPQVDGVTWGGPGPQKEDEVCTMPVPGLN